MTRDSATPGVAVRPVERGRRALRGIGGLQAGIGLALLAAPTSATRVVCRADTTAPPWITRLLGARMAAQGMVLMARPSPLVALAGAAADGSHAASMVAVPRWAPRYRRPATCSAATAAAFSMALAACAAPSLRPLLLRVRPATPPTRP